MLFSRSVVSDSFAIPWTVECQAPLSMGFPRQEYWSGLPFILQGIFPSQGSTLHLLHWQEDSLPLSHEGSPVLGTALDKCYLLLLHLSFFFHLFLSVGGQLLHNISVDFVHLSFMNSCIRS